MESCDYKVCGGDSIPFAQWSPETLGAGFVLPFALTNSERLPSALPTGETLPSFAAAAACPNPSHRQTKMGVTRKGCSHFCVEVAGFEPAAFRSRTKRATKLRYTSILEPMRGLEPLTC